MNPTYPANDYWSQLSGGGVLLQVLPFIILLLVIAVAPLVSAYTQWWEKHRNKFLISALCGFTGVLLYIVPTGDLSKVLHTYLEYAAFMTLLASLYIISGGIHISGSFAGFPYINTLFLAVGAVLSNFFGTTGASLILIRPLLHANRYRKHKSHIVVFFIFIVSNCGGLLTPLGDPPLYLGFLRGVPFGWTFSLLGPWALTVLVLLFIFHILDEVYFSREELATKGLLTEEIAKSLKKIHVEGWPNALLLLGVIGVILSSSYWVFPSLTRLGSPNVAEIGSKLFQILFMGLLALASYKWTPKNIHEQNQFSLGPIQEVTVLFFGIFGAMIPTLALLETHAASMPLAAPWQFFWLTGILSGFLDNAPTYLTFVTVAANHYGIPMNRLDILAQRFPELLGAVSCGAVFMGALTYIGNGPNFMVKAIAEHMKVRMPSFGGYLLWSGAVLIPVFILVTLVFYR